MERRKASNELRAKIFKALSDPSRLKILDALLQLNEAPVSKISQTIEMDEKDVLNQVGVLREAKLVLVRRIGAYSYYRPVQAASIDKILASTDDMLVTIEEMRRKGQIK